MRILLQPSISETPLRDVLPLTGTVLHTESNLAEWAIVALDKPVSIGGVPVALLFLRPAKAGFRVGDLMPNPVHVALVTDVGSTEGRPVYRLGKLLGQFVCSAAQGAIQMTNEHFNS